MSFTIGIVGAGAAGLGLATFLADAGHRVEILERAEAPSALGSGITLQGNALRVLRRLGVWPQVRQAGYAFDVLGLRAPGPEATVLARIDDEKVGGPDLPATLGMYRPDLTRILRERAESAGAVLRYGANVEAVEEDADSVTVHTRDGIRRRYGLLVGADGLHSRVRECLGVPGVPERTGMGIWRAFVRRPAEVTHTDLYYGGPAYIAGYCPTSEDTLYAYLVEDVQDRDLADGPAIMRELAAGYGGPWDEIRAQLDESARVNYTHFTSHIIDGDWFRGRVALVGDAAHSCPPTIAQGAAMALEDAAVLADEIAQVAAADAGSGESSAAAAPTAASLAEAFGRYTARRAPRARVVVENSVRLGQWMLDGNRDGDVPGLMREVAAVVSAPV
ncbi:FAD-dependent monooxygenase [Saxibacter everestensis]|uniref:FAD-dependent monooxygenase n=1 Tax=Saxibacter everestensis TaxID=2909229 RepID=A0ABY8QU18_9MICO|nr:FAD-dependent monooxygenase [Brevibacteriaceae bacterium ZFBP1038]